MNLQQAFKGKKVFLTGHTGFKGAWMLQMLHRLGAVVAGYSLPPDAKVSLYEQIDGAGLCQISIMGDVRDKNALNDAVKRFEPDFIFHLAAQSLVKEGYRNPVDTFEVNIMGTVNVLEAIRLLTKPCIGLMITTDKVYANREDGSAYEEHEPLGGYDPYSASKAADELVIGSYRSSFFHADHYSLHLKSIASLRAGNVIGGGDYAADRIVPDIIRSIGAGQPVQLRYPNAVRPWQHVLEPLHAYLCLAAAMVQRPQELSGSYNVGPNSNDELRVEELVRILISALGEGSYTLPREEPAVHEASLLHLDNSKIYDAIGIKPKLTVQQAISWTAGWYADLHTPAATKCARQIEQYWYK